MKRYNLFILLLVIAPFMYGCAVTEVEHDPRYIDTVVLSKSDTAFIDRPVLNIHDVSCKDSVCRINIRFSNKLPDLKYREVIGAELATAGDLDGDGKAELLLRPELTTGCWSSVHVYSVRNGAWKSVVSGSVYWCSDHIALNKRVEKAGKSYILACDSMGDIDFLTVRKPITF